MRITRAIRLAFLIVIELSRKYTRSLILGFFIGLALSLVFWKTFPLLSSTLLHPTEYIGLVGDFTPSTLPLSVQQLLSRGLTELSENGSPLPSLASDWEATNSGKTFIFTLRDDLTWHNGDPVTSHDVNYSIRGVTLIPEGDRTLVAYLQYPYSPFPILVSKPIFLPGLNGFGPYSIGNIKLRGDLVKSMYLYPVDATSGNPKHISFYQTEAQALLAFRLGEIDVLENISNASAFSSWPNVTITEKVKYDRIVTMFFNMKDGSVSDKAVRQGLAYGVPDLPYEKAGSPISRQSWAFTKNVRNYVYNPSESKRLLKDSPLATSSGQLVLSTFPAYLDTAQQIASSWTSLGIPTTVKVESALPQEFQVLLSAQDLPPDPDQYPFWHSTQFQTNITGYANVKIDKLLEDGRLELNQEKRAQIYSDFQRRLVEEAPAVFLYYPSAYTVRRGK